MVPESSKYDVFISYPHEQKITADAVCANLEKNKIKCWIAPRDVLPGEPFAKAIIRAMNESRLFVVIFCAESNESDHVKNEVERAVSKGLSIIAFRVQDVIPSEEMEYYLSRHHWLDAITPPLEAHIQKLTKAVAALLAKPIPADTAVVDEQRVAELRTRAREEAAQGNWPQAIDLLEQAKTALPDDPRASEILETVKRDQHLAELRQQAQARLEARDWPAAITHLEAAATLAPGVAEVAGLLDQARREQRLTELRPQAAERMAAKDWPAAVALLEEAARLAPDNPSIAENLSQARRGQTVAGLRVQAQEHLDARAWPAAIKLLEEIANLAPDDPGAAEGLALARRGLRVAALRKTAQEHLDARAWPAAIPPLEEAARLAPGDPGIAESLNLARRGLRAAGLLGQARALATAQDWPGALAVLKPAREAAPDDPEIAELLARTEQELRIGALRTDAKAALDARRWEEALPLLETLRGLAPTDAEARAWFAAASREASRHRQLDALLKHAADGTQRASEIVRAKQWDIAAGAWQDATDGWATALTALNEQATAFPQDAVWRTRAADAHRSQEEAAQQAARFRALGQRYAAAQTALGAGRLDQAIPWLTDLAAEEPGYRDVAQLLTTAKRRQNIGGLKNNRPLLIGAAALTLVALVALAFLTGLVRLPGRTSTQERAADLPQALAQNLVELQLRGTGAAFGECITAKLTRRVPDLLTLSVPRGTVLRSKDPAIGDMVVMGVAAVVNREGGLTRTDTIRLESDDPQEYVLEAYGLDAQGQPPTVGTFFAVGDPAADAIQRTLQAGATLSADANVGSGPVQMALWLLDEGVSQADICQRLTCRQGDLESAQQILMQAGLRPTSTPTLAPPPATAPPSPTPVPPTDTPAPTPTASAAPSATPTAPATATASPTASSTPAAAAAAKPTATRPPAAKPTATRPPATRPPAGSLALQSPADGTAFLGKTAQIRLGWSPLARGLAADEYYVVTLTFPHDTAVWTDYQWSRTPSVTLPDYLFDNVTGDRIFRWQVSAVRLDSGEAKGDPQGRSTVVVPTGATRTFKWLTGDGVPGGGSTGPGATPSLTPVPVPNTPRPPGIVP